MQCSWLQQQGAKVISLGPQLMSTDGGFLRVWPHLLDAEGFFVACFSKDAAPQSYPEKTQDVELFGGLSLQRLPTADVTLLEQRVRQELNYSLPPGIPVVDEQGDVFLLSKHFSCLRGLLPYALMPGLRLLTPQGLSKELRLVAGDNLSSQEWINLHSSTGGGLGAASLAVKCAEDAPAATAAFQEMLWQRLIPDLVSYNTLLNAHAKAADGAQAKEVLDEMINVSITPGVVSFTIVIEAYARSGDRAAAEEAGICTGIMKADSTLVGGVSRQLL
eukprot:symbB.v1.2.007402.t1/scaffold452.1/size203995/15